jgi:hypothetical protein
VWYGYRKWRALASHMVTDHCSKEALTYRRIAAEQKRKELAAKKHAA